VTALVTATGISGDQWGSDCFPIQQVADPTRTLYPVRIPLSAILSTTKTALEFGQVSPSDYLLEVDAIAAVPEQ
jgi:hypothetical protein